MNNNLIRLIDEYVALCGQLCKKAGDYTRENVVRHNRAIKRLNSLKNDVAIDRNLAENMYSVLLNHEDIYVRQDAATECLSLDIHITASIKILKKICRGSDRMAAMGAKRTLQIWEGKINPQDPF